MKEKIHVGKKIDDLIHAQRLDYKDVAKFMKMTPQNIRDLKKRSDVSTKILFDIAEFLHVDPCVFIRKVESSSTEISVNEPQAAYGTVGNDSKDKIIKVLESENAMLKDYVETLKRVTKKDGY